MPFPSSSQISNPLFLSHEDFVKVFQWEIIEAVEGSYVDHLRSYALSLDAHGALPPHVYKERVEFVKAWQAPARNSRRVCIDIETGEVFIPLNVHLQNSIERKGAPV